MLCKPPFGIEIVKGDNVLSLHCVFPQAYETPDDEKYGMLCAIYVIL